MEKEAEVFGPRTISGFLSQVGAEESMTADQVVWSEQGRLHLSYKGNVNSATTGANTGTGVTNIAQVTIENDIDGSAGFTAANHGVRVNDTIIVANSDGIFKCLVTVVNGAVLDVATLWIFCFSCWFNTTADGTTILVYGSEYGKGDAVHNSCWYYKYCITDTRGANEPAFKTFTNKPIIMKDYYEVSGSDTARIGWVEVTSEAGASGYLWYLKAEADTRARFH